MHWLYPISPPPIPKKRSNGQMVFEERDTIKEMTKIHKRIFKDLVSLLNSKEKHCIRHSKHTDAVSHSTWEIDFQCEYLHMTAFLNEWSYIHMLYASIPFELSIKTKCKHRMNLVEVSWFLCVLPKFVFTKIGLNSDLIKLHGSLVPINNGPYFRCKRICHWHDLHVHKERRMEEWKTY